MKNVSRFSSRGEKWSSAFHALGHTIRRSLEAQRGRNGFFPDLVCLVAAALLLTETGRWDANYSINVRSRGPFDAAGLCRRLFDGYSRKKEKDR